MDTNNLQQINNFADGMNTDTSDAFLSESSYRLANNLRYITNQQENSGELHMIEGAKLIASVDLQIIASASLRDIAIFVTTDRSTSWSVYTMDKNNTINKVLYITNNNNPDNRVIDPTCKLSLVTRWENDTNQKLYIADGLGPVLVVPLTPERVIESIELIISYPAVAFKKPIFCGLVDGNITAPVVCYSYQFYKKYGHQSEISPQTKLISLFKGNTTVKESDKITGYLLDDIPDKGVRIKIPGINNNIRKSFDRVKIYRISFFETGQVPTIECVYDEKLPLDSQIIFDDKGYTTLEVLTLEQYNALTGIHIAPKIIESKDDYMFAANIKDETATFKVKNWNTNNVNITLVTVDLIGDKSLNPDNILARPTDNFLNNSIQYNYIQNNTIMTGTFDMSDYIESNQDVLGYWNPQASYMFRSLRRGETYRFGIIFYDKHGNSSGVIHIKDLLIDDSKLLPMFEKKNGLLIVRPVGIKIDFTSFPAEAVSYEIVRCGRSIFDVLTIAQGVISRPLCSPYIGKTKQYALTPSGIITIHDTEFGSSTLSAENALNFNPYKNYEFERTNYDIYEFISPEVSYLKDTIKDELRGFLLYLQPVQYIKPYTNKADRIVTISDTDATYSVNVINYGNKYANIIPKESYGTVWTDPAYPELDSYGFKGTEKFLATGREELVADYLEYPETSIDLSRNNDFQHNEYHLIKNRFAYAKLYNSQSKPLEELKISNFTFPEILGWDDFATADTENFDLIYPDKISTIGGRLYVNWVCGDKYGKGYSDLNIEGYKDGSTKNTVAMGPGGSSLLIKLDILNDRGVAENPASNIEDADRICTFLCNIRKRSNSYTEDSNSKKNSLYRSFGDYFNVSDGNSSKIIFDGDCFVSVFEYVSQHKFEHISSRYYRNMCKIFAIPVETSINLAYTSGFEFNREYNKWSNDISYILENAANVNNLFILDTPMYVYNSVYSTIDTSKTLFSELVSDEDDPDKLDYRVYHSKIKTNNESIDNWLNYLAADYLDVDTRSGKITGLRKFKNQLLFWQESALGTLSVNERTVITDDSNAQLVLGTGGVLTRYDYVTTSNGMYPNEYADAQSNTTLYWWDKFNKSICGYSGEGDAAELSKVKFVLNHLNKLQPLESPVVAYDNHTKDVVSSVVNGSGHEFGSVIYNEHFGHFSSIYSIQPDTKVELHDRLLFTKQNKIFRWNEFASNDSVKGLNSEAIKPYLKYIVNSAGQYTKVFDNGEFAGRMYKGDENLKYLKFMFSTPLKLYTELPGTEILNREYNFRYIIPRNLENNNYPQYGNRMRGKTMQCELESSSNSYDFSLLYVKTKFRISWS